MKTEKPLRLKSDKSDNLGKIKKNQKKFISVYKSSFGHISKACNAQGICRQTFYRWMKEDGDFCETIHDIDESNIDLAESKLLGLIRMSDFKAIQFYLRSKAKKRGYSDLTIVSQDGREQSEFWNTYIDSFSSRLVDV